MFEPLDIETWNDGHAALAALASTGHLRAVVTTNFDRLIELALDSGRRGPAVYCAPKDFERLPHESGARRRPSVIKVHGSVGRAETMVDTLRQRVLGRPQALEAALARLFSRPRGARRRLLRRRPRLRPAVPRPARRARASPSFTVVNREGGEPTEALAELVAAAGSARASSTARCPSASSRGARSARGTLVEPGFDTEMEFPGLRQRRAGGGGALCVGGSLSPVRAAVVLASIAEAAGSSDAAFRLLLRTMPYHLKAGLYDDPALPKQLGMIAATLIEAATSTRS